MPVKKKRRGAPPGSVNNPTGKNQHANDRGKMIGFRMPLALEEKFLARVQGLKITNTQAVCMAIEQWLETS
jgi:hypothetical protein